MKKYLIDTNICIYFLKGQFNLDQKLDEAGIQNCYLSEITVAKLKFGIAKSVKQDKNRLIVEGFMNKLNIIPIFPALDFYAEEKARLRKEGRIVDDFDLLIGASAVVNKLTLVTRNVRDFERIKGLDWEDWTS